MDERVSECQTTDEKSGSKMVKSTSAVPPSNVGPEQSPDAAHKSTDSKVSVCGEDNVRADFSSKSVSVETKTRLNSCHHFAAPLTGTKLSDHSPVGSCSSTLRQVSSCEKQETIPFQDSQADPSPEQNPASKVRSEVPVAEIVTSRSKSRETAANKTVTLGSKSQKEAADYKAAFLEVSHVKQHKTGTDECPTDTAAEMQVANKNQRNKNLAGRRSCSKIKENNEVNILQKVRVKEMVYDTPGRQFSKKTSENKKKKKKKKKRKVKMNHEKQEQSFDKERLGTQNLLDSEFVKDKLRCLIEPVSNEINLTNKEEEWKGFGNTAALALHGNCIIACPVYSIDDCNRSFRNYTGNGNPSVLAANGFVHDPEGGPAFTYCIYCRVTCSVWESTDDVRAEHRRMSPDCPFFYIENALLGRMSSTIICLSSSDSEDNDHNEPETSDVTRSGNASPASEIPPAVHHHVSIDNLPADSQGNGQGRTFHRNSGVTRQRRDPSSVQLELQRGQTQGRTDSTGDTVATRLQGHTGANLIYQSTEDPGSEPFYECRHSRRDHDPWVEHARWSSQCYCVRGRGTAALAPDVQRCHSAQVHEQERVQNARSWHIDRDRPPPEASATHAAQLLRAMGYEADMARNVVEETRYRTGQTDVSLEQVVDTLLDATPDLPYPDLPFRLPVPNLVGRVQMQQTGGLRCTVLRAASVPTSTRGPTGAVHLSTAHSATGWPDHGGACGTGWTQTQDLAQACMNCRRVPANVIFKPCQHKVCCQTCANNVKQCPHCRRTVKGTVEIG